MTETCEKCRFWREGSCRANSLPPTETVSQYIVGPRSFGIVKSGESTETKYSWPITKKADYCGEWEAKE